MGRMKWVRKLRGEKPGVLVVRKVQCDHCNGFGGHLEGTGFRECHICWGEGEL